MPLLSYGYLPNCDEYTRTYHNKRPETDDYRLGYCRFWTGWIYVLLSPLFSVTEEGSIRGESWKTEISEYISTKNYLQALHVVDSIIKSKQAGLPRFAYLDRFLAEEKRVDVANARADIYELQWKRIGILKEMGNRKSLVEALNDYCTIIGYNQDKAKTMLNSLESE